MVLDDRVYDDEDRDEEWEKLRLVKLAFIIIIGVLVIASLVWMLVAYELRVPLEERCLSNPRLLYARACTMKESCLKSCVLYLRGSSGGS